MDLPVVVLVITFVLFLMMNTPIAVAIAMSSFLTMITAGINEAPVTIAQRMSTGIEKFSLLAIPFFILSGILMGKGGMARRLIDFASSLVGRFTGGLGYVNVLTCMLFGSISGSAAAAVSSVGGFMIPEMNKKGYDKNFNTAVTTTAATTGLMIPPSNVMIVYSLASGSVSIAAMFMAGILPGIIFGLALMLVSGIISNKRGYGAGKKASFRQILKSFTGAIPSLSLIFIIIAGILLGWYTPTEAAVIAVVYSFLLAVVFYREVKLKNIPNILLQAGITTSVVFLLIGASSAMSWLLSYQQIPQQVSAALLAISDNKYIILLIINVLLLIVGTFMDMTPAVLIFTPILLPVVSSLGIHPVHYGVFMIANLCIGLCTPPVGTCLFVGCGIGKTTVANVTRPLIPFFIAMTGALMFITFIPALSLWIPGLFNLLQ